MSVTTTTPTATEIARTNMVESQLRPNRVHDADLLQAMLNIPREAFLPEGLRAVAYGDKGGKLGGGKYLTEPLITARLLDYAGIEKQHLVLVIGGATAYVAAVAAQLARQVVAIEADDALRGIGEAALAGCGIKNVLLRSGNPVDGVPENGPFDIVVIDGAVATVPQALIDQLTSSGRLVTVLAPQENNSHGVLVERVGASLSQRVVFDGFTPYLPDCAPIPQFEFV